ncbi:DUF6339 family protein [Planobispora takensis]|uniref:Uncharacterized protein n=1 Tax=Planobispora takensis TaxID=1367882 RepID=A0A8J3WUB6_9ACTN|nr:DUF6339 family protein [Planobispora takensis]GII02754.1 hypothetical protein Pta02_47620 [Planobispora takensis]
MGFLYPRLLAGQARPLHEEYRHLPITDLMGRATTAHDSAVYIATGGDRVSETRLRELRDLVVDLAKESGFPNESNRELRAAFDLRLAAALHSEMRLVPAEAASGDVWAFLALVLLPDVAYWRYPVPPGDRVLATDLTRHVFGRMWWRAQLVHSPGDSDPYAALNILGEAAFDQIYARRKALGNSPHLVKAILRVWNELDLRGLGERDALQDFLKRLLRLTPFVLFEALSDQSLDGELRRATRETVSALLSTTSLTADERQIRIDAVFGGSAEGDARVGWTGTTPAPHGEVSPVQPPSAQTDRFSLDEPAPGGTEGIDQSAGGTTPYNAYRGQGFGDPFELGLRERAEAIAAVVAAEGPVQAVRVYRIISRLAGMPLDDVTVGILVSATKYAVRTRLIEAESEIGQADYLRATLRLPGQPTCALRTRGPRDLDEIPGRELVTAVQSVQAEGPTQDHDVLAERVSLLLGEEKPTERFKEILLEALQRYGL